MVSVTPFDVFAQARCAALLMREWLMAYWAMVSAEISMMPGIEIASASAASSIYCLIFLGTRWNGRLT